MHRNYWLNSNTGLVIWSHPDMPFFFPDEHIECKLAYCSKAVHKQSISPHFRKLFWISCKYITPNTLIQSQELQAPVCTAGIVKPDWGHILVTSFQNTQEKWNGNLWQYQGKQEATAPEVTASIFYFSLPLACRRTALSCPVPLPSPATLLSFPVGILASHPLSSQLCRIAPLSHPSKNFLAAVLLFPIYFLRNSIFYKNLSDCMKSSVMRDFKSCSFHLCAISLE